MKPVFFPSPAAWRRWLAKHHATEDELLVGYWKRATGRPSLTWPESVDQALCFGWIDGIRRSLGAESYVIRFTPRRTGSIWSAVNVRRARELIRLRLMRRAGLAAFKAREDKPSGYSYEQPQAFKLPLAYQRRFRRTPRAWRFFQALAPGYRKMTTWWVISAKQEETRLRRLAQLIAMCKAGRTPGVLAPSTGRKPR
jgi:uncharacterized protein YdeI (YjbR/CyaY-like superfamily)